MNFLEKKASNVMWVFTVHQANYYRGNSRAHMFGNLIPKMHRIWELLPFRGF